MKLTSEQEVILKESGNLKINAVAGSGKTTTIIEYAKTRNPKSAILYLAFNKSVKLDAKKKFLQHGLKNVTVETAHSLAYRNVVMNSNYRINAFGYKIHEIAEILGITGNDEKHSEFVLANHIKKFFSYFCNSDKQRIEELNYLEIVADPKAKAFVRTHYTFIQKQTINLFLKMEQGKIEITHDFYLKKFQLSNPKLHYDYILFDEGQDASAAMLDVFFKQSATKIIVGDTHQQIYSWRFAVNSLEKADYQTRFLSASFRFNQEIADLAMSVLGWKKFLDLTNQLSIIGDGKRTEVKSKAIIARTNLGLLLKAIEYVTENKAIQNIYFEGNFHSYTYAEDGASLYDVLNLHNNKRGMIKDKLIREMQSMKELEEYISKTEDMELGMMVEIVKRYDNEIPKIIKLIKEKHLTGDDKEQAEMIFSTVHRCKGMEYDSIELANDFIYEEKVKKTAVDLKKENFSYTKLTEEINLLYVAITRTRNQLFIPLKFIPTSFQSFENSETIHVLRSEVPEEVEEELFDNPSGTLSVPASKSYSVEEFRTRHADAYKPWTDDFDSELSELFARGTNIKELSNYFGRTNGAIRSRIKKLNLRD
ncbi:UvrD-helicase domain-containing protein [Fluviicola sp.]|uniref:UvrD-helicase domain-containing protein n=1 Tax=Fluviicola sp. TaxID=1917219 RepID=UPI0031D71B2A